MTTLLILADDLTGALDTGVQIAQLQVNTQVRLYAGPDTLRSAEEAEVLVIDTESRHLPRNGRPSWSPAWCERPRRRACPISIKRRTPSCAAMWARS